MGRRLTTHAAVLLLLTLDLIQLHPPGPAPATTPTAAGSRPPATTTTIPAAGSSDARAAAVVAEMRAAGPPYSEWVAQRRRFLAFDSRGDGRAIEVLGELDRADRIAVLVPGVGSTLPDFDRGLGGIARRAPAAQARALYTRLQVTDPAARVAVIAWLGYDPPNGVNLAAARWTSAHAGAAALAGFARSLATLRPSARITLIGHSYGAVVLGLAAPDLPCQVTDLVALGGVGMAADRATDLGGPARVWAAEAADDWIRRLPPARLLGLGHGVRPAAESFGAYRLPAGARSGHDGYLLPGGATLPALVTVVLGAPEPLR